MLTTLRQQYNLRFSASRYQAMLDWIAAQHGHRPPFKIAETPIFLPPDFKERLIEAGEQVVDLLARPDFRELSAPAIPLGQSVPGETPHPAFLVVDFGVCVDENGAYQPRLIEIQGFPSLFFFQLLLAEAYRRHFDIPDNFTSLFNGLDETAYLEQLRRVILAGHDVENVILLEIEPEKQPTAIDFIVAKALLGIEYVCVSALEVEGKAVYYRKNGRKIRINRIFNRVIFDEMIRRDDLRRAFFFSHEHDVEWAGHPNWFFRISKHTLPLFDSPYVPASYFLDKLPEIPEDLHNYVLKPLFSFAGTGVIINLNRFDIDAIRDRENYILQRRVRYAPVIPTPDEEAAKCEIRLLMVWEKEAPRPRLVNNLVRLSKGEMVGTRHNQNRNWVGGSVAFFQS
jgi:hypothetical protein